MSNFAVARGEEGEGRRCGAWRAARYFAMARDS